MRAVLRIRGYNLGVATVPMLWLVWDTQLTAEYSMTKAQTLLTCPRTQNMAADMPRVGFRIRDEEGR